MFLKNLHKKVLSENSSLSTRFLLYGGENLKKRKETIAKGIIALLFSQVLIKIIGLAYKLYLTNKEGFGDEGNAIYSAGFQIYALLLTFSSTGVPNAIAKLVAERMAIGDNKGAHRIFKIAFFTFAFFGLSGTILLFLGAKTIAAQFLEIPEAEYSLITLSPSIFFVSIISVIRGYFNGRQNLSVTAKSQTIEQIFKTIFTIALVEVVACVTKNNTMLMAGIANLATTLATIVSFVYVYWYYRIKREEIGTEIAQSVNYIPTRIRKTLKKILKESIPISLSSLISSFNKNIDLFTIVKILKRFMSESEAKIQYGILSGKVDTLCALPLALNVPFVTGMVPTISRIVAIGDKEELNKKINFFLKITIIIALPCTAGLIIFSNQILNLLFPNANSGAILLQINAISIFFAILSQTINGVLQGIGKSNVPLNSFSIGMIFKFFANILLVSNQNIGIKGAAIGNIICNGIVFIIGMIFLIKNINLKFDKKNLILKPIFATVVMSVFCIFINFFLKNYLSEKINTITSITLGTSVYVILILALKIVKK